MNVSEIKSRVTRTFGDEAGAQITSEDIIRWVNDGQLEIAGNNHLLEQKASANIVAGQSVYSTPPDVLEIWAIRYNNYKLRAMSMQQADEYITNTEDSQNYQRGAPAIFWLWENQINLYPIPDISVTGGLAIYYSRIPVQVTVDTDIPELPVAYHPRIVEYCMKQAYELDEDYQASGLKAQQLTVNLNDMLEGEKWTSRDFYPTITVLPGDL